MPERTITLRLNASEANALDTLMQQSNENTAAGAIKDAIQALPLVVAAHETWQLEAQTQQLKAAEYYDALHAVATALTHAANVTNTERHPMELSMGPR